MGLMMTTPALALHGGAVYPWSEKIEAKYQRFDRFDEEYQLGLRVGGEFWIPRRLAPGVAEDLRIDGPHVAFANHFTPKHEDQARVVDEAKGLLDKGESFILQAPTGYGKTFIGCTLAAHVRRRTLVITTKEDLIGSWQKAAFTVLGLQEHEFGVWRGDELPDPKNTFVVGLVHSLLKGPSRYPAWMFNHFGFVIPDEVHRMAADQFSQAMWWLPARLRMGLSATPYRKDGREEVFHNHIGPVAVVGEQETMVPKVIMEHDTGYKVPRKWSDKSGKWVKIHHTPGRTGHLMKGLAGTAKRNVKIARFVRIAWEKGRTIVVFADTMNHLHKLREVILKNGVPEESVGWYVGLTAPCYTGSPLDRRHQREQVAAKCKVILATYKMASEGTDFPWWDTCVLAGPRSDVNQIVGRIRREWPDKLVPLVFDPVDNDSKVFADYARKRVQWYKSIGAPVVVYGRK